MFGNCQRIARKFPVARNLLVTFPQLRPAEEMEMPAHKFLNESVFPLEKLFKWLICKQILGIRQRKGVFQ